MRILTEGTLATPQGFLCGAAYAGLKAAEEGQRDIGILVSEYPCAVAGVFTQSTFRAAPVRWCQQVVAGGTARALVVNSGNANAATGDEGYRNTQAMAAAVAAKFGLSTNEVLVASTGVIGVQLPMQKLQAGIRSVTPTREGGNEFCRAMMTTDTFQKQRAAEVTIGGAAGVIAGAAKGAGMIHPDMATMLSFVTTDFALEPAFLRAALKQAADRSFNMVSVDTDTSTNDTLLLLANGAAGNPPIAAGSAEAAAFQEALDEICTHLAKCIARDGEGATKLIEVRVRGAATLEDARCAARTVTASPLVKAAVYGNDPNLGRVLMAIGRSGAAVDQDKTDVFLGPICFMRSGIPQAFDRAAASKLMDQKEVLLVVDLHLGDAEATAWGCDLTEEYVRFNALYTT